MLTTDQLNRKERRVSWERRFQSVMLTIIGPAICWGVFTLASVDKSLPLLAQRVDLVEVQQAGSMQRREAQRDHTDLSKRIDSTDSAIVIIDGRLKVIEATAKRKKADK